MQVLDYSNEQCLAIFFYIPFCGRCSMNKLLLSLSLVFLSLVVTGCSKQEGPAEQLGKKVDESIEGSKKAIDETIEKATKKIEELTADSKGPAEQAGKEIDEAVEDLKRSASDAYEDAEEEIDEASEALKEKSGATTGGGY
jgi:dsDNA-specific endonuclease/ATPase MutS2